MMPSKTASEVRDLIIRTIGSIGFSAFITRTPASGCGNQPENYGAFSDIATRSFTGYQLGGFFRRVFKFGFCALLLGSFSVFARNFPTEIHLTNGATLKKCEAVRWEREAVVVRHAGGVAPIRFENIAADQRAAVLASRPSAEPVVAQPPVENPEDRRTYQGQVFVATVAGTTVILSGVTVCVFPARYLSEFEGLSTTVRLPKPTLSTVTDADGRFSLTVPNDEPFFFYASSGRYIGRHGYEYDARVRMPPTESYDWIVSSANVKDRKAVLLTNENLSKRDFMVLIEK